MHIIVPLTPYVLVSPRVLLYNLLYWLVDRFAVVIKTRNCLMYKQQQAFSKYVVFSSLDTLK